MPKGIRKSLQEFTRDAIDKHGQRYQYSLVQYVNDYTPVALECTTHGIFWQRPSAHLQGKGCSLCARTSQASSNFVQKAQMRHENFYGYTEVEYTNNYTKVRIHCPVHGVFFQRPNAHLSGKGCYSCGNDTKRISGLYENPEKAKQPATLYLLQMDTPDESFLKVGKTIHSIRHRYAGRPWNTFYIIEMKMLRGSLLTISQQEQYILTRFKNYQYFPQCVLPTGKTECFAIQALHDILEYMNTL